MKDIPIDKLNSLKQTRLAKIGTFKIIESFNISDRGIIIVGYLLMVMLKLDQQVSLKSKGHPPT